MGMQGIIPPNIDYNKNVSDRYEKKIYKKGETCIKYNKLHQAKENIDAPEEWNPVHWEETTVEQIRAQIQQKLSVVNTKKMSYVSYVNTRTEPLTTNDASYIVLDTKKAFLNKGVYAITVFGTISSSGGTAQLRVVFDGGERGFAQNTQNIYNSCSETILYEVSESNEYTFEFSLGCNVNKATLYPYVKYGYSIFQIY